MTKCVIESRRRTPAFDAAYRRSTGVPTPVRRSWEPFDEPEPVFGASTINGITICSHGFHLTKRLVGVILRDTRADGRRR
jgi:hypothetical protein